MKQPALSSLFYFSFLMLVATLIAGQQLIDLSNNTIDNTDSSQVTSRRKRFIIFPRGSSLQLVFCFLTTAYGTGNFGLFTIGITVGFAWEIPQDPRPYLENATLAFIHRQHRRDLYPRVETFLDKLGVMGRPCILRAICEAKHHQQGNGSFIEEIVNSLFSYPLVGDGEDEDLNTIYDEPHEMNDCSKYRKSCPTSILDFDVTGTSKLSKTSRDVT